jgi:type III secretion system FlhB-like substrate exporter
MGRKRHTPEQIIRKVQEVEVALVELTQLAESLQGIGVNVEE